MEVYRLLCLNREAAYLVHKFVIWDGNIKVFTCVFKVSADPRLEMMIPVEHQDIIGVVNE